jgi:hypothetical protein
MLGKTLPGLGQAYLHGGSGYLATPLQPESFRLVMFAQGFSQRATLTLRQMNQGRETILRAEPSLGGRT